MAEVKRAPKWIMLEALRNNVLGMHLEKSDGTTVGVGGVVPAEFAISTQDYEPVLRLGSTKTLEVGVGDTITAIVLWMDDTDAPEIYDADDDRQILYPIVDVDGNGETFPDGGSIDVTEFEVNLDDL